MRYDPKFSDYVRICGWGHYDLEFESCSSCDEIAAYLVKHNMAEKYNAEELWAKFEEYQNFKNRRSFLAHPGNGVHVVSRGEPGGPEKDGELMTWAVQVNPVCICFNPDASDKYVEKVIGTAIGASSRSLLITLPATEEDHRKWELFIMMIAEFSGVEVECYAPEAGDTVH